MQYEKEIQKNSKKPEYGFSCSYPCQPFPTSPSHLDPPYPHSVSSSKINRHQNDNNKMK